MVEYTDLVISKVIETRNFVIETDQESLVVREYTPLTNCCGTIAPSANHDKYYSLAVPIPTAQGLQMGEIKIENAKTLEEAVAGLNSTLRRHLAAIEKVMNQARLITPDSNKKIELVR
jgi:hypothetical protein